MPKLLYVDSDELERRIKSSGIKYTYISECLGISKQGLLKKRKGITAWKASEAFVMCYLLQITDPKEKEKIFSEKVEEKVNQED